MAHTDFLHDVAAVQHTGRSLLLDQDPRKRGDEGEGKTGDGRSDGVGGKAQEVVVRNSLREGWIGDVREEVHIAGCNGHSRGLVRSLSKEGNQKAPCHILGNHQVGLLVSGREEVRTIHHHHLLSGSVVERKTHRMSVKCPQRTVEDHESSGKDEAQKVDNEKMKRKEVGRGSCNNHRFRCLLFHLCDEGLVEDLRGRDMTPKGCCSLRVDGGRCCFRLRCGDGKKEEG